jgi:tetratricopeptide (TPR) repeat protein
MSRFVNLEFGGQDQGDGAPQVPAELGLAKDELFYHREAQAAFEEGDFQKALRCYARILEFAPQDIAAWAGQVRMLMELNQLEEAKNWADKALERFPRNAELLAAKAVVLAHQGETQPALAFSDAAVAENNASPYVWLARGDVLLTARETLSDYCINKALVLAPGDWLTAWQAGRIRMRHGQFSLALRNLQQAVQWNPGHFLPWLEQGRCQQSLGLDDAARKSFAQACELNRQNRNAAEALAKLSEHGSGNRLVAWWRRLKK